MGRRPQLLVETTRPHLATIFDIVDIISRFVHRQILGVEDLSRIQKNQIGRLLEERGIETFDHLMDLYVNSSGRMGDALLDLSNSFQNHEIVAYRFDVPNTDIEVRNFPKEEFHENSNKVLDTILRSFLNNSQYRSVPTFLEEDFYVTPEPGDQPFRFLPSHKYELVGFHIDAEFVPGDRVDDDEIFDCAYVEVPENFSYKTLMKINNIGHLYATMYQLSRNKFKEELLDSLVLGDSTVQFGHLSVLVFLRLKWNVAYSAAEIFQKYFESPVGKEYIRNYIYRRRYNQMRKSKSQTRRHRQSKRR